MKTVLELVKGKVNFEYYRSGYLYYSTSVDPDFIFPVPISDTGEATFKNKDKGLFLMRYIRMHMEEIEKNN